MSNHINKCEFSKELGEKKKFPVEIYDPKSKSVITVDNMKYDMLNAYKNGSLYIVHLMNDIPPSIFTDMREEYGEYNVNKSIFPDRSSLHFATNQMVPPHGRGNWETNRYALILNSKDAMDAIFGTEFLDSVVVNGISYRNKDIHFIIPKNDIIQDYKNPLLSDKYINKYTKNLLIDSGYKSSNIHEYDIPDDAIINYYDENMKDSNIDFTKKNTLIHIQNKCDINKYDCETMKITASKMGNTIRDAVTSTINNIFKERGLNIFLEKKIGKGREEKNVYHLVNPNTGDYCVIDNNEIQNMVSYNITGDDSFLDDQPRSIINELRQYGESGYPDKISFDNFDRAPYVKLIKLIDNIKRYVLNNPDRESIGVKLDDHIKNNMISLITILENAGKKYLSAVYDKDPKYAHDLYTDMKNAYNNYLLDYDDKYIDLFGKYVENLQKLKNLKLGGSINDSYYKQKYIKYKTKYLKEKEKKRIFNSY